MAMLLVLHSAPYHRCHIFAATTTLLSSFMHRHSASFPSHSRRRLLPSPLRVPARVIESSPWPTKQDPPPAAGEAQEPPPAAPEFEVEELGWGSQLAVTLRMLVAPPWKRIRKGSILNMKLRGEVGIWNATNQELKLCRQLILLRKIGSFSSCCCSLACSSLS